MSDLNLGEVPSAARSVRASSRQSRAVHHECSQTSAAASSEQTPPPAAREPTFLERRLLYRVIVNFVDSTPDNIVDPQHAVMDAHCTPAAFDTRPRAPPPDAPAACAAQDLGLSVYATTVDLDDIHIDHTKNTEVGVVHDDGDVERAPSAFSFPAIIPRAAYPPSVLVALRETETVFLLSLPSCTVERGAPDAAAVEADNDFYDYITRGKGRNRKTVTEETQTAAGVTQTRHTMATRPQKKNAAAFASVWDMHDTYARLAQETRAPEPDEMVLYRSAAGELLRPRLAVAAQRSAADEFQDVFRSPAFKDALMLTERVLAATEFGEQQKVYRGLVRVDPLSLELVYDYTLRPLWTLRAEGLAGRAAAAVAVNPRDRDLLAVGLGKFLYAEGGGGAVCVWCTKNPTKPERTYTFEAPVTSLAFSERHPSWLAVGFYDGAVAILDVTSHELRCLARSRRETNPRFEPVWCVLWRGGGADAAEAVVAAGQDGRVDRFVRTKTHDFICSPMMRLSSVEGRTRGLDAARGCARAAVPVTRHPAALSLLWHAAVAHQYYVGTDEGCVHVCSAHYLNQHMDVFRAHAGPVYCLAASPFHRALFATAGADGAVRLWMSGVAECILSLPCAGAVYGLAFCPTNSTIILSASGNCLSVWDLRRRTHAPCAEHRLGAGATLTHVGFPRGGDGVLAAATDGAVHMFRLEDTPLPPFDQRRLLADAVKRALVTRPHVLKQLEKLERYDPNFM